MHEPSSPVSTVLGDSDNDVWAPISKDILSRHLKNLEEFLHKSDCIMNDIVTYGAILADLMRHEPSRTLKRF